MEWICSSQVLARYLKMHLPQITHIYVHGNGLQHEDILALLKDDPSKDLHQIGSQRYAVRMSDNVFCAYLPDVKVRNLADAADTFRRDLRTRYLRTLRYGGYPDAHSNMLTTKCVSDYPAGCRIPPIKHYNCIEPRWSIDRDKDDHDLLFNERDHLLPPISQDLIDSIDDRDHRQRKYGVVCDC